MSDLKNWLDGPGLVAWLEAEDLLYVDADERASRNSVSRTAGEPEHPTLRRIRDWRQPGARASVGTVDTFLVFKGRHLSELPDHLWREYATRPRRISLDTRAEIRSLYTAGVGPRAIADRLGIAESTVAKIVADLPRQMPQKSKTRA